MTDFGNGYINAVAFLENGTEHLTKTDNYDILSLASGKTLDITNNKLRFYRQYRLNLEHTFLCDGLFCKGFVFIFKDYGVRDIHALYFKLKINGIIEDNVAYYQTTSYKSGNEIELCVEYNTENVHEAIPIIESAVYYKFSGPDCRFLFGSQEFPCVAIDEEISTMRRIDCEYKHIMAKKHQSAYAVSKSSFWRKSAAPSWKIYPEAVLLLSWVADQTKKIDKIMNTLHEDLKDINLQPPKEEKVIFIPIECTCDKRYNIRMWLLRNHSIVSRVISGFDMLQYQIPVSFNNMELIILVYGIHYLVPIGCDLKEVLGIDCSINTNQQVEEACLLLKLIKNTDDTVRKNYRENIIIESSIFKKFLETREKLSRWINQIYNQAYEQYIKAKNSYVWKSEYRLFKYVNLLYPGAVYQYHPTWLEGQSLDIFIPQESCAIEYQGQQHYQALDYFGGESGYKYRQEMDSIKKGRCKQNGILLLEWLYTERVLFSTLVDFLNNNVPNANIDRDFILKQLELKEPILAGDEDCLPVAKKAVEKKKKSEEFEIRKYDSQGVLMDCYSSVEIAAQDTGISKAQIQKVISGYNRSAGGFQWKKVKRNDEKASIPPLAKPRQNSGENESKAVYQIDLNGTICAEFGSIGTAVRATGINRKSIYDALRGRQKAAGGYIWKYKENEEETESQI